MTDSTPHSTDPGQHGPAVGQDEWVARHGERRTGRGGPLGIVEARLRAVPWWAWLVLFLACASLMPAVESSGYVRRVGFDTVIFMLLALGLNVVVGWGGLLDLGYIAFFGIGSYAYAIFDSAKFGFHLPTIMAIPAITILGALAGLLVGLPSRRLSGDYLAIVTFFFLELFETVATNGNQIFGHNVTGGANGILNVDPLRFFGHTLVVQHAGIFAVSYYYVALAVFLLVFLALRFVDRSRTGRAWRSLREDPLAAEVMGMPVNWLKLTAFATGAAVAALTGTISTALSASVFPLNFSPVVLITVYAMVILGGSGSQAGVVGGAIIVNVLLQLLQNPGQARVLFYVMIVVGALAAFRLSRRLGVLVASTAVFGFVAHAVAGSIHHSWIDGAHGGFAGAIGDWVIVPAHLATWVAPVSYGALIACALLLTLLRDPRLRLAALAPTLYLAAFVWENVMLPNPGPARYVVLGLLLIVLMIARPNGLLGERRVEII
ncbi:MAG TPA: branched-chain amino acid ABC transporter permease [Gaiellaceae bacterium]|nr:branched-chain amino acid ABC transporter permease [Gaiellaceae bacterium]